MPDRLQDVTCRVDIVDLPARPVLALRRRGPLTNIGAAMRTLRELAAAAGLQTTGPMAARFHDYAGMDADADYEVVIGVLLPPGAPFPEALGEAHGEWLPSRRALETVHYGPHDRMDAAWDALAAACVARGEAPAGPVEEVYEATRADGLPPEQYVTRVRLPLRS